jgi:hypothetical protein
MNTFTHWCGRQIITLEGETLVLAPPSMEKQSGDAPSPVA